MMMYPDFSFRILYVFFENGNIFKSWDPKGPLQDIFSMLFPKNTDLCLGLLLYKSICVILVHFGNFGKTNGSSYFAHGGDARWLATDARAPCRSTYVSNEKRDTTHAVI